MPRKIQGFMDVRIAVEVESDAPHWKNEASLVIDAVLQSLRDNGFIKAAALIQGGPWHEEDSEGGA